MRVIAEFPSRSIGHFGSSGFTHSRLARGEVQVALVELDGLIGGHEAVSRQLLVVLRGRRRVAAALERVLANAGAPGSYYLAGRVHRWRHEIRDLAELLRAPDTCAEPTSVALCWQLLRSAAESPLYNWHLPAEDLGIVVRRIRAGIRRSPATES